MPNKKAHIKIAKKVSNLPANEIEKINSLIDSPIALKMFGPRHREAWGHSVKDILLITALSKNKGETLKVAMTHLALDSLPIKLRRFLDAYYS